MTQAARGARPQVVLPWLVLASALVACALYQFTGRAFPFYGDEVELFTAATGIQRDGLLSAFKYSDRRTYLFPLILSLLPPERDIIFGVHLLAFECAAACLFLCLVARSRANGVWLTGCAIFLNPFALLYLGYALTEAFSIVFIIAYAVLLVSACDRTRGRAPFSLLAGAALGCAVMVRPSNLFLVGALPLLLLSDWLRAPVVPSVRQRMLASLARLSSFVAGFCLLAAPQIHNNLRHHQSATPIVVSYAKQEVVDAALVERSIKYATAISPKSGRAVAAVYADPYRQARASESAFVRVAAGIAKRVTTLFALIDQDRPIPYNRGMFPWFRTPASLASLAMFFSGLVGILAEIAGGVRRPGTLLNRLSSLFDAERLPALVLGSLALGCLLAFSRFHTEARYGLPALVLVSCFIPHAWAHWRSFSTRIRLAVGLGFAAWMALGMSLSFWIERDIDMSPPRPRARASRRSPPTRSAPPAVDPPPTP